MGRFGFRNKGVPISGVMDEIAANELNRLLQNSSADALLEITMTGPKLEFDAATVIALGGADFKAKINGKLIGNYKCYCIAKGDVLEYGSAKDGVRGYLAVKGGIRSDKILGSRSYYFPVTTERYLMDGDVLSYLPHEGNDEPKSNLNTDYLSETLLEVHRGPEFDLLTDRQLGQLFGREFTVAKENNRMAYQLEEKLDVHTQSMLTSATLPGTVQFTPSGKLIILMKDGQTTGGYPRILQLVPKAIAVLSQKKAGETILFKII